MARYIDADKLIEHLKDEIKACEPSVGSRANGRSVAYGTKLGLQSAISFAETLATADVAQKSEVAREIFEEIEAEITEALKCNYKRRTEYYTKERYHKECGEFINTVSGKIDALRGIEGFVKELKKKYMEEQK